MSELLTFEEAARLVHVSPETIRYWAKTSRIKTVPKFISKRSGKPYGQLVRRADVLDAHPVNRTKLLKQQSPHQLLTVSEVASTLQIQRNLVYKLVNRLGLEKVWVDGWNYMVSGEHLIEALREDPTYWHLLRRLDDRESLPADLAPYSSMW